MQAQPKTALRDVSRHRDCILLSRDNGRRQTRTRGRGIYGDILGHSVILIEYEPAHIDRVNYTIIAIARLRVVGLVS
jgi:hypothetical protein